MSNHLKQGEIWQAVFHIGWERPAIVVSGNELNRGRLVLVVPCTSSRVRLGALEILEEISGDHFDFDPWEPWQADPLAEAALEKWKAWAEKSDPESPEGNRPHKKSDFLEKSDFSSRSFYTALSSRQLTRYLNDMISADRVAGFKDMPRCFYFASMIPVP